MKNPNAPSEGPLKTAEGVDVFIPPAPVKPGFDRAPITYSETWGYVGRPSKVKYPLPEGWRPARALTPREEGRLEAMRVWVTARGVEMADWEAFFTEWLAKPEPPNRGDYSNGKSVLAAADRLIDQLGGREAAARYKPGSAGPRQLDFPTHPAGIRSLPKG